MADRKKTGFFPVDRSRRLIGFTLPSPRRRPPDWAVMLSGANGSMSACRMASALIGRRWRSLETTLYFRGSGLAAESAVPALV